MELPVPRIGQGTWQMERDDRALAIRALARGIDLGLTHVDTAELYGSGAVEELVAEAIAGRRDEVFLASKVMPDNATRKGTISACERSLARLRTDRLDLYMLHWPGSHPLEGTIAAFEELLAQGKILRYGVSNFDVDEVEQALAITGPNKIACNQVLYHPGERTIEHRVIPLCREQGIPVVAYSPFGAGTFHPESAGGGAIARIAARRRVSARQVALAFLMRIPGVYPIPKAAHPDHVADNAKALGLELGEDEVAAIDAALPRGRRRDLATI
jgi:diketogulonate reductase-like aldo/keto reductase